MKQPETSHEDDITCPFCGQKVSDSWECTLDADVFVTECDDCGRQFSVTRHTCVTYSTTAKANRKGSK